MVLKSNFSRSAIMVIFSLLQGIFISIVFYVLCYIYKIPLNIFLFISIIYILFVAVEPFSATQKIFSKYCNKECQNCSMWHCNFHFKDGKYFK